MSFTWYDVVVGVLLLGIVLFESRQNFGRSMMDALAALVAVLLASFWTGTASVMFRVLDDPMANAAVIYLSLFALFLAGGLVLSRVGHHLWLYFSADPFDWLFGGVFGMAIALILGHAITFGLHSYYGAVKPGYLANSHAAQELVDLRVLRSRVDSFIRSSTGHS